MSHYIEKANICQTCDLVRQGSADAGGGGGGGVIWIRAHSYTNNGTVNTNGGAGGPGGNKGTNGTIGKATNGANGGNGANGYIFVEIVP